MKLGNYFKNGVQYLPSDLKSLLEIVVAAILTHEPDFKNFECDILDGETTSGYEGEVLETGRIILDSKKLLKYDRDVALAIVAHELAHAFCGHHLKEPVGLEFEVEADGYAKKWGFQVDKFRKVCGPPTTTW